MFATFWLRVENFGLLRRSQYIPLLVSMYYYYYYYTSLTASFPGQPWISRYEKGKTSLDLNEARNDRVL